MDFKTDFENIKGLRVCATVPELSSSVACSESS